MASVHEIQPLDDAEAIEADLSGAELARREGRIADASLGLRRLAARGTIINAAFRLGISALTLAQRLLVAIFLTPSELGVWGVVVITLMTLLFFKNVGISDKFIQQAEEDQELAFQKAFSFELLLTLGFTALAAVLLPAFAAAYGEPQIILPGLVLLIAVVGNSFQAPTWIFYRRMQYARQRRLEAIDPTVTFVVTVVLAISGAGYWSLVAGAVAGAWSAAAAAVHASPYRLRVRVDRAAFREYLGFSWPLFAAQFGGILVAQGSVLVGTHAVGVAGVGAIALAVSITAFSDGVDAIVTQTIYPAICAVRDDTALLLETFVKSNRVALMWGVPFGIGLVLFAPDLVHFVIGNKWEPAIVLLQAFGAMAAIDQLGFNWTAFLRARNETRPLAIVGAVMVISFAAAAIPLLIVDGLDGYAIGMLAMTAATLTARTYFLARLFESFRMVWHAARAIAPTVPAVAIVLLARLLEGGPRSLGAAAVEFAVYAIVTVAATALLERALLREAIGYLRRPRTPAQQVAASAAPAPTHM